MTRKLSIATIAIVLGCLTFLICTNVPTDMGTLQQNIGATSLVSPADASVDNVLTPTLVWKSVQGATKYSVQVATKNDFSVIVLDTAVIDTFTVVPLPKLENQTKYYWRVQVHDSKSSSDWTPCNAFTTTGNSVITTPVTPKTASPADSATGQPLSLTLTWNTVTGATTYAVQVASDSTFATIVIQDMSLTVTTKAISGLSSGTKYYWRVAAINTAGQSGWSDTMSFTTLTKTTFTLTISATNGSVTKYPDLAAYDSGTVVTLTPMPATNYHFSGWSGALSGPANPDTITMTGAKSVTAGFAVNSSDSFALTVLAINGKVKKTPDLLQYASGSFVGLKATANTGYHFVNWSGDTAGTTDSITILMTGAKNVTANFAINTPSSDTITFDKNDAAATGAMAPQIIASGSSASLTPNTYTKTGWTFAGWMTSPTGTTVAFADKAGYAAGTTNVTLWAKWIKKATFSLTVSAINGSVSKVPDSTAYDSGTVVTLTPMPANNYHFSGWSGDLTGTDNPATITMNGAKSVTAGFTVNPTNSYSLTVMATNGTVKKTPDSTLFTSGSSVGLKATANTGYHFVSWSGDAAGTADSTTVQMTGAKSVTANFAKNQYALTMANDGNGTTTPVAGISNVNDGDSTAISATAATGYQFSGWIVTPTNAATVLTTTAASTKVILTSAATVKANFTKITYALTMANDGNGSTTPTTGTTSVNYGVATAITASPGTGYKFASWTINPSSAGTIASATSVSTSVTLTAGPATVTANFTQNSYTLTMANDGNGSTSPATSASVAYGTSTSITATPSTGYQFSNWTITTAAGTATITNASSANTSVTLYNHATVKAIFSPINYTLTMANDGNGSTSPATSATAAYGSSTSISATPATGSKFSNWTITTAAGTATITNSSSSSTTVTLYNNATVKANFSPINYTLTMANDGNGSTNPATSATVAYGSSTSIAATPSTGYQFSNWIITTAAGTATITNTSSASTTVTLYNNATIKANFTPLYSLTYNGNGYTGGTVPSTVNNIVPGSSVTVSGPSSLTKTCNTFSKWNTLANGNGISYAANALITITANTTLYAQWTATVPPTISGPVNQTVCAGNSATFSVSTSGTPATGYQWYTIGSNQSNLLIYGATSASYTTSTAGYYFCAINYGSGCSVNSSQVYLGVTNLSISFTDASSNCPTVTLTVTAPCAVSYQWHMTLSDYSGDMTLVDDGKYFTGATTNQLTTNITPYGSTALYYCVATDADGKTVRCNYISYSDYCQ